MTNTPNLGLTLLSPNQAQASVVINGNMSVIDAAAGALTFATLPSSPTDGTRRFISDSLTAAAGNFGTAVTVGGGGNHVPVYWDAGGSTWRIG